MKSSSVKMFSSLSVLSAGLCLSGNLAHALPSKRGNAALPKEVVNQIVADPALKGVQVLPDHDPTVKVLYVSPANRKPQLGNFIRTADPNCQTIKGLYDTTFMLPTYQTPEDLMKVAADPNAPVSAFFFLHFAGSVRQEDVLNQIQQIYNQTEALLNQNSAAYDRYLGAKLKFEDAQKVTQSVQESIQHLDDEIKKSQDQFMLAQDDTARQAARAALDAAILHKQQQYPALAQKLNQDQDLETDARNEFVDAHSGVASLLQNLQQSNDRLDFNTKLFEARKKVALDEYTMALATLESRENRTIGSANVAVQVWADEAARVDQIVKNVGGDFASYTVQRLPIHNVTLDGRYWESSTQTADGSGTGLGNGKIDQLTTDSSLAVGDPVKVDSPYRDDKGNTIEMLVKTLGQRDAFALDIPISAGSFCMTQGKAEEDRIEFPVVENGATQKNVMTIRKYVPRSEPVLKPSFALNYEYFVKAEPMDVTCELNQDLFFKSVQDSGSSGFLFWRHSWSTQDLTQAQSEGIDCKVKSSPIGDDINLQRQMESDLVESFSKDLAAEAILLRAKEWKVTQADVALPAPSQGFKMIGTGVLAICGGNPYCMVGGIVLKSIEELFGSQTASGDNTYHYSTKLTRNFNYDGFTVDRASVIIDAEIR